MAIWLRCAPSAPYTADTNNRKREMTLKPKTLLRVPTLIIDTREQKPFTFSSFDPKPQTVIQVLTTGDYSVAGYEDHITVERKSLTDLFSSFGQGRDRFEREVQRMSEFRYAAIVCEADWMTIIKNPPPHTRLSPKSILASVVAWQQRYGVHFWACPGRQFAERLTYRILNRYFCDMTGSTYGKKSN